MDVTLLYFYPIIALALINFVADHILQSRYMGKNKSKDIKVLISHGLTLFICFILFGKLSFMDDTSIVLFSAIYCTLHIIQDWCIWNAYAWLVKWRTAKTYFSGDMKNKLLEEHLGQFKYYEDKAFYTVLGLDQTLHFITIMLTYTMVI